MSKPIVIDQLEKKAPLHSPTFTGEPQAPTPASGDISKKIATTEFISSTETLTKYVKKSGDTMTGQLTINVSNNPYIKIVDSSNTWYVQSYNNKLYLGTGINGGSPMYITSTGTLAVPYQVITTSAELTGSTPYIDFHYDNSNKNQDYNVRLINSADNTLVLSAANTPSQFDIFSCFQFRRNVETTDRTSVGYITSLDILGTEYGNISDYLATAGKMSYGDPGPQIRFGANAADINLTNSDRQPSALIYTCHDAIKQGVSLSFVTSTNGIRTNFIADKIWGAVWNDYAEFRAQEETIKPGYCVTCANDGKLRKTDKRMQHCEGVVSDTFGFAIGQNQECQTPIAVAGRVLVFCEGLPQDYNSGDSVCSAPDGKVSLMTREEIKEYPDRIVGIVSEIPTYEIWGDGKVSTEGRIWIRIK